MTNLKIEFLLEELKRVVEWVKFADTKSSFLLVLYTGIISILVTSRKEIIKLLSTNNNLNWQYIILLGCVCLFIVLGFYFLIKSFFPSTKNSNTNLSLFYFGTASSYKFLDYLAEFQNVSEEEIKRQIIEQIHTNSCVVQAKMESIKISTIIGFCLLVLSLLLTSLS